MKQDFFNELLDYKTGRTEAKLIRPIVPIEKWINSEYYVGPDAPNIYPFWKKHIINIFNSKEKINEVIVHGSIGTGKSTFANIVLLRKLYELSCYENIQSLFNLMVTSSIALIYFNISKDQAELTGYGQLKQMLDAIPYFKDHFPRNTHKTNDIEWPDNNMYITYGSSTNHAIGANLFGSILDEANFYGGESPTASTNFRTAGSKAMEIYASIRRRGESRFKKGGVDNSISLLLSSTKNSNSFTERRIAASKGNPHVYVIDAKIWEVKPSGTYSNKKFWVFIGNEHLDPFLPKSLADVNNVLDSIQLPRLEYNSMLSDEDNIRNAINSIKDEGHRSLFMEIPIDFKNSFETDIVTAIQDIAGVPVAPMGRLFQSRKHYVECIDDRLEHPFIQDEILISTGTNTELSEFIRSDWVPKNLDRRRFVHIDQSTSNDSTGISAVYIDKVVKENNETIIYINVDFMLRINPPLPPEQIDIAKVRRLLPYLRKTYGMKFGKITYDIFASAESRQALINEGFDADYRSVDRTDEAYMTLCRMIYDHRIKFYRYQRFEDELFELQHDRSRHKVDHPPTGTKDVADSLAGAVMNAMESSEVTEILRKSDVKVMMNIFGNSKSSLGMVPDNSWI